MNSYFLRLFFLFSFSILFNRALFTQVASYYFEDDTFKPRGGAITDAFVNQEDSTFILAGMYFDLLKFNPAVMKVDTNGKLIWTTSWFDTGEYYEGPYQLQSIDNIYHSDDGFIYASFNSYIFGMAGHEKWLWKVNENTGEIMWKLKFQEFEGSFASRSADFIDYDSTRLLLAYLHNDNYAYENYYKIAFISRETGEVLELKEIIFTGSESEGTFFAFNERIEIDSDKNIYYAISDSLFKTDGDDLNSVVWRVRLENTLEIIEDYRLVNYVLYIEDEPGDHIYVFATADHGPIVTMVDKTTGTQIWTHEFSHGSVSDYKIKDDFIYYTTEPLVTLGSDYFSIARVNKFNGEEDWETNYDVQGIELDELCIAEDMILGFEITEDNKLFATGVYGSSDFEWGNWGFIRINPVNGNVLYEKNVTNDPDVCAIIARGIRPLVIGNSIYYAGEIALADGGDKLYDKIPYIVKSNKNTGEILFKKPVGGIYQFGSHTIDIRKFNDKIIVLKQQGLQCRLELYDSLKVLQWQSVVVGGYKFHGTTLHVGDDSTIWVAGFSKAELNEEPYYDIYLNDSLHLQRFDINGNLLERQAIAGLLEDYFPIDVLSDHDTAYILYKSGMSQRLLSYFDGTFSPYYLSVGSAPISGYGNYYNWQKLVEVKPDKLHCIGYSTTYEGLYLRQIDKATFTIDYIDTLKGIRNGYHCLPLNDSLVVLSGYDVSLDVPAQTFEVVQLYNVNAHDSVWTVKTDEYPYYVSKFYMSTVDPANEFIYSAGFSEDEYFIYKIRVSDGNITWKRSYNEVELYDSQPYLSLDLEYDEFNHILILTGARDTSYGTEDGSNIFVKLIDTTGNLISSYVLEPLVINWYLSNCVESFGDGTFWVGGNCDKPGYEMAGVILEFDTIYEYPVDTTIVDSCYADFSWSESGEGLLNFTDESAGSDGSEIISWNWDFYCIDETSDIPDPSVSFPEGTVCACLTVTDILSCTDTHCEEFPLSIEQIRNEFFKIYPNPLTSGEFIIECDGILTDFNLFDWAGREVPCSKNENNVFLISDTSPGLYCMTFQINGIGYASIIVVSE